MNLNKETRKPNINFLEGFTSKDVLCLYKYPSFIAYKNVVHDEFIKVLLYANPVCIKAIQTGVSTHKY